MIRAVSPAILALKAELVASASGGCLLTEERRAVVNLKPQELLKKLKSGTLSAVRVLEAFQAKVNLLLLLFSFSGKVEILLDCNAC